MFLITRIFFICAITVFASAACEERIQGILLVPEEEALEGLDTAHIRGVVNSGVPLPEPSEKILTDLESKYLGEPLSEEELVKIKRAIIRHYRRSGHPAVAVRIDQQEIGNGIAIFVITEAEANICFEGKRWVSKEHLEKYVDIRTGENIAQDVLLNNVNWLNRNPFRRTFVLFAPDSEEGVSDLKFIEEDKFPVRFFLGGDNSGTKFTGRTRLYGGLTWGHVLGREDLIHYQYTINPDLHKFQSHYGVYYSFLPWKHILSLYGIYETTKKDGKFAQGSFRYTMPLEPLFGEFKHETTVGVDYKNVNTNLFFIDSHHPIFSRSVNIGQLAVNYSLVRDWERNELELSAEYFYSPGRILANQSNSAYRTLRPHAKAWYSYGRLTVGDVYMLPRCCSLSALVRLQATMSPLLPTEQFGLGGYDTVRGYHERAFNADEALCANLEFRAPPLHFVKKWEDECIFLAFIDYGLGYNLKPSPGYPASGHLLGIGPGVRYQIDTHFSLRADYGFRFHKVPGQDGHGGVAHLGVVGFF